MTVTYTGYDPGKKGGMVRLDAEGRLLQAFRIPVHTGKKPDYNLHMIAAFAEPKTDRAAIEKVHSMPGQGVASMFSFGRGLGLLEMSVVAQGIPHTLVTPQAWQKVMLAGMPRKKETKKSAVLVASRLWPELAVQLAVKANWGLADAALIAEYGRRFWGGEVAR